MKKNGKARTWSRCIIAFALTMVLAISPLFGGIHVEASETPESGKLNVADYKGDRAKEKWDVPKKDGQIFAGWYEDAEYTKVYTDTTGSAYPKFVDANVLTVKKQLKADTTGTSKTTDIRFLTAIDSLYFKGVTFNVKIPESWKDWTKTETTAYLSMLEVVEGENQERFPESVFGTTDAKYFVAHSFTGIPKAAFGHKFSVTPSWVTMDGTTVVGKTLEFTINGELLEGSLFTDQVTMGESKIKSDVSVWNWENASEGTLTVENGDLNKPMILKGTGTTALLSTKIDNISGDWNNGNSSWARNVYGGLWITDGENYGLLMAECDGIAMGDLNFDFYRQNKYVLMCPGTGGNGSIKMTIALQNGLIYLYLDNVFVRKVKVSEVVLNAQDDAELAFGFQMKVGDDNESAGKDAVLQFSNISYTTDESEVNAFLQPEDGIGAKQVTVNGNPMNSAENKWNRENESEGILTVKNGSWSNPMILEGVGTAALLQTTIKNVGGTEAEGWLRNVFGGFWATDGNNYGFLMAINNAIAVGNDRNYRPISLDKYVLMPPGSGGENPIKLAVARKGAYIYVYVDDVFKWKLRVSDVVLNASDDTELAFGLTMDRGGDKSKEAELQFSNITYTTDAGKVEAFLDNNPPTE